MEIDFTQDPLSDYTTVPPGRYRVRVAEVRCGLTRDGHDRWSLRLVACDPSAAPDTIGKLAAWDALVFTKQGKARIRQVFEALDLPCQGKVSVEPQDLEGRMAFVTITVAEYTSADGESIRRNEVPFDGWQVRR